VYTRIQRETQTENKTWRTCVREKDKERQNKRHTETETETHRQ